MMKFLKKLKNIKNFHKKSHQEEEIIAAEEESTSNDTFEDNSSEFRDLPPLKRNFKLTSLKLKWMWLKALPRNSKALKQVEIELAALKPSKSATTNASLTDLFKPAYRGKIHKTFLILLFISMTYSLGKITAYIVKGKPESITIATPPATTGTMSANFSVIKTADLFYSGKADKEDEKPKDKEDRPKICKKADKKSQLPLELINSIVMQDSVKSIASVQVRNEPELSEIREGDIVGGMAQVGKIERLNVIFKNLQTKECEFITNQDELAMRKSSINVLSPQESKRVLKEQKAGKALKNTGNKFEISRNFINEKLKNIGTILTQARAIQVNNPDGSLCFNIQEVVPGSIYSTLDIQNNDTICKINGNKITSMNQVMDLFGKIRQLDKLDISVKRNGVETTKEYRFTK